MYGTKQVGGGGEKKQRKKDDCYVLAVDVTEEKVKAGESAARAGGGARLLQV